MSAIRVTVNTIIGDDNFGNIVVEFNQDDADLLPINTVEADFYVKVVDPSGVTSRDFPSVPDLTTGDPLGSGYLDLATIPLSNNSLGNDFLRGTYQLIVQVVQAGSNQLPDSNVTCSFVVNPAVTSEETNAESDNGLFGVLADTVNCKTAIVTFVDESDHDGWTITQQNITIQPPIIAGQPAPEAVTTEDNDTAFLSFSWTNVTYTAVLDVLRNMEPTFTGNVGTFQVIFTESLIATASAEIDCGQGVCDLLPCLDSKFNAAYNEACEHGGWGKVKSKSLNELQALAIMAQMYDLHSRCGNITSAETYKAKITAMFGSNCSCGCSDTPTNSEPKPYNNGGASSDNALLLE